MAPKPVKKSLKKTKDQARKAAARAEAEHAAAKAARARLAARSATSGGDTADQPAEAAVGFEEERTTPDALETTAPVLPAPGTLDTTEPLLPAPDALDPTTLVVPTPSDTLPAAPDSSPADEHRSAAERLAARDALSDVPSGSGDAVDAPDETTSEASLESISEAVTLPGADALAAPTAGAPTDSDELRGANALERMPSGPPAPPEGEKPVDAQRAFVPAEPVFEAGEPEPEAAPPPAPVEHRTYGPLRAGIPPMYIVQITPELAPVAKVGGLADVVFGLARELALRGNSVEIVLPKYDCMRYDHIWGLHVVYQDLWVPWWGGRVHCSVWYGEVHGRKCYFIEPHSQENYFNRGKFYGDNDDVLRFAFFSRAAMEYLYKSGKHPDIIHCHDWQTGLVPVFLYEIYQHLGMHHPRVCFTVHNFKHQGVTGEFLLWATELGRTHYYLHPDRLRDNANHGAVNLMKAGIVYSNFVTTVSPNHAYEAKTGQGHGLEHSLHVHHVKYGGVVNGIDYDVWNPEVDRYIPHRYGIYNIDDKYRNKKALRDRLWLHDCAKPIIAYIGRLDDQKGLDLIKHAAFWALRSNAQFVLLGTAPDPRVQNDFWHLKRQLNDNPDSHIELSFNEELSHLIYAGADLVLVPSRFEPCGLTQLVAMRYGTVPVVRAVGGLADTVFDKDFDWRPLHERNGYVFQHYSTQAVEWALGRAVACYYEYPEHFRHLMLNGMRTDYSWNIPGQHYLNIYDHIRNR